MFGQGELLDEGAHHRLYTLTPWQTLYMVLSVDEWPNDAPAGAKHMS